MALAAQLLREEAAKLGLEAAEVAVADPGDSRAAVQVLAAAEAPEEQMVARGL